MSTFNFNKISFSKYIFFIYDFNFLIHIPVFSLIQIYFPHRKPIYPTLLVFVSISHKRLNLYMYLYLCAIVYLIVDICEKAQPARRHLTCSDRSDSYFSGIRQLYRKCPTKTALIKAKRQKTKLNEI